MATFEEFLNMAKDAAEAAGKKTGDLLDMTKLKMEIARVEKELASTYEGLGRLTYDAKKGAEDTSDLMDTCVAHIDELSEKLAGLQNKLADKKHAVRCAACGSLNEQDAAFCKACGEKL